MTSTRRLEKVTLPSGLQSVTLGDDSNYTWKVTLPSGLQSITFDGDFMIARRR